MDKMKNDFKLSDVNETQDAGEDIQNTVTAGITEKLASFCCQAFDCFMNTELLGSDVCAFRWTRKSIIQHRNNWWIWGWLPLGPSPSVDLYHHLANLPVIKG